MVRERATGAHGAAGRGGEVDRAAGAAALAAFRREQPFGWQAEAVQPARRPWTSASSAVGGRPRLRRAARTSPAPRAASTAADGLAQIDEVGTLEAAPRARPRERRGAGRGRGAEAEGCDPIFLVTDAADWPQQLYRRLGFDHDRRGRTSSSSCRSASPGHNRQAAMEPRMPCMVQDAAHRRGADAGVHERGGAAPHARDAARCGSGAARAGELWHKGETSGNVQRLRALRWTATTTPCWRWSTPPGPPATPASAPASTAATWSPQPAEALPRAGAHDRRPRPRRRPGHELHGRAAGRPGARSARRSREEAEEVARAAREESDARVAEEAADVLYHLAVLLAVRGTSAWPMPSRCSMSVAAEPAELRPDRPSLDEVRALAREHTLVPLRHTFIADTRDAGVRLPQAARRRALVPAGVGRAGPARSGAGRSSGFRPRT